MGQYLQWEEAKPIRDTSECLLVDEPEHYTHLMKKAPFRCFFYAQKIWLPMVVITGLDQIQLFVAVFGLK